MNSCSFINNKAPKNSWLIYNHFDDLKIDNCYFDNSIPEKFADENAVSINHPRDPFTNKLIHLSTGNCQAEFAIINKSISKVNKLSLFFISLLNIKKSS